MKNAFKRLVVAALTLVMVCGGAQASVGAYVTQDNLPVFSVPYYTQQTFIGTVNAGDALEVLAIQGDWAMVARDGNIGYTGVAYLTPASSGGSSSASTQRIPGYVTQPTALYAAPSFSAQQITYLNWGTQVYVTAIQGDAARVENADGSIGGYVPLGCLSPTQPQRIEGYAACDAPLYQSASSSSRQITTIPLGTAVYVIGMTGNFCCVQNSEGTITGYVYTSLLSQTPVVTQSVPGYTACNTALFQLPSLSSNNFALAAGTPLYVIGYSADGNFCCVQNVEGTVRGYIPRAHLTRNAPQSSALDQLKAQVIMADWFDSARYALNPGSYYTLYDIRNGQTINVKYTTGSSHMDIEPATAEDTAKLLQALGGSWTYVRTQFILIAEGCFVAASLYGEPHGSTDTISGNNMDGVVCLHLTNSRTHGSDRVDEDHQAAILTAYNWAHS